MDKKQIIILLIIAGVYIFNAIRKMKAKSDTNNSPEEHPSSDDYEYEYEKEVEIEPVKMDTIPKKNFNPMVKNYQFIAESLETTSLETESLETFSNDKPIKKSPIFDSQISDNENDNTNVISIEMEEVRKGFIYSEILQKKYN